MILNCPFCNAKVRPSDQDCPACRQRMTRKCPSCAETVALNASACKYCGEEIKRGQTAARGAAPTPGIEFIEEPRAAAPARRKCSGRAKWLVLLVLAGLFTAGVVVRTDCVVCSARPEHEACVITKTSVSHCGRRFCKDGKTALWVTVVEKLGGRIPGCGTMKSCCQDE